MLEKIISGNSLRRWTLVGLALLCLVFGKATRGGSLQDQDETQFGPVVRAYLGYLRDEQEVVDDRASRREISRVYYKRNLNRIRALRATAIRIARESGNDYLPELEAVATDEFGTLFEHPPKPADLRVGEVLANTFRFVGAVRSSEIFYVFARLAPYEQATPKRNGEGATGGQSPIPGPKPTQSPMRPRRVSTP